MNSFLFDSIIYLINSLLLHLIIYVIINNESTNKIAQREANPFRPDDQHDTYNILRIEHRRLCPLQVDMAQNQPKKE